MTVEELQDGDLRGYFAVLPEFDVQGGSRTPEGLWKNVDFLRLKDRALHVLDPRPGQVILDVGCAAGPQMVYCGLQGASVYGQDLDPGLVKEANGFLERFGLTGEATCGDVADLPFPDNHFDSAISSDFFEHVTEDEKARILPEVRRVLKPGGKLVVKTPNLNYLKLSLLQKRVKAVLRGSNPKVIVIPHTPGTDDPQHTGLTSRWEFSHRLLDAGFQNFEFFYAPLRRFGRSGIAEVLSTEIPVVRDFVCEDLFCVAYKPIAMSHFPD
jgi:SAM-dependent methyltransferase